MSEANEDTPRSPETLTPIERMDGLQLRFILGPQFIDSSKELPPSIIAADIRDINNRDYSTFQTASTYCRIAETQLGVTEKKMPAHFNEQKTQWIQNTTNVFNSEANTEKIDKLKPVLSKLGVNQINNDSIGLLYVRLFENKSLGTYESNGKSYTSTDIKAFVQAVIESHTQNGDFSYDSLKHNLAEYRWFAKIFGSDMQDAIVQLIDAEARIKLNKDTFINETMVEVNGKPRAAFENLSDSEKKILDYLKNHTKPREKPAEKGNTTQNQNKSSDQEQKKSDYSELSSEDLKNLEQFSIREIHNIVAPSEVLKKGLPVYYPGAGTDIKIPLAYSDAQTFIFVDFIYIDKDGNLNTTYSVDKSITDLGGTISKTQIEGKLGQGGKRIIEFELNGKKRTIIQYAEDATKFTPSEIENGASLVMTFAPTTAPREGSVELPGSIYGEESTKKQLKMVVVGGFTTFIPNKILSELSMGFQQVHEAPPRTKTTEVIQPLYVKLWDEPAFDQIMDLDSALFGAIARRDGYFAPLTNDSLEQYKNNLKQIRTALDKIPESRRKQLLPSIRSSLVPQPGEIIQTWMAQGKNIGFSDEKNLFKYFKETTDAVALLFPELQQISIPLDKKKLLVPDETRETISNKYEKLKLEPKAERLEKMSVNNTEAAALFCDSLRRELAVYGIQSPQPVRTEPDGTKIFAYLHPRSTSKIRIDAPSREAIADAWFSTSDFTQWAQDNGLPMAYYMKPGHATLVIRGPHKENNQWKMRIYDPLKGEEDIQLNPKVDLQEFIESRRKEYQKYYDPEKKMYMIPNQYTIHEKNFERVMFSDWLNQQGTIPNGAVALVENEFANESMSKGEYDLTLTQADGIPANIIASKTDRFQFDGKNCVPLCLFAAVIRATAKSGFSPNRRQTIRNNFAESFNIVPLLREQILAEQTPQN